MKVENKTSFEETLGGLDLELPIGTEKVNGKYFRIEERVESNGSVCLRISLAITSYVNFCQFQRESQQWCVERQECF